MPTLHTYQALTATQLADLLSWCLTHIGGRLHIENKPPREDPDENRRIMTSMIDRNRIYAPVYGEEKILGHNFFIPAVEDFEAVRAAWETTIGAAVFLDIEVPGWERCDYNKWFRELDDDKEVHIIGAGMTFQVRVLDLETGDLTDVGTFESLEQATAAGQSCDTMAGDDIASVDCRA